ncbi:bacillithiol biosynthesis cysteine-adding enzyme BshC [Salirhabdus salicampi]|uniref:bacillithiol biosynthesis cysteine-adding enzyme BshC n=1 Tax=Salirhabdus salicampi TaxID=476102 RepID=UPI0020C2A043|nr:bacillithiol biosynthesis cysteine-adding enzyme BshC [Salirhabdus salicampi]MCP8616613.1 bacillithiol biosynthesis cysteine-adding enzyme BshC [Salirhabdus salicampi]
MWLNPVTLSKSKFIHDYEQGLESALQNFHYILDDESTYMERYKDLTERSFQRKNLVEVLKEDNERWGAPPSTMENIERLLDEDSVVIVGGQQAGLLTGPLYTIHKIVSILHLAKEKEKQLNKPVVPLFWVAGEDHDFAEINHVSLPHPPRMKKYKILQKQEQHLSVSSMQINQDEGERWLGNIFKQLKETAYTNRLYEDLLHCLKDSETFVDFFANVIFHLFDREGIVLLDSHSPRVRKLESEYFIEMIRHQEAIASSVQQKIHDNGKLGYTIPVEAERNSGHLFYHLNGERVLLFIDEDGKWTGKNRECSFSTEELVAIAKDKPELLSNNVVTRPLMQEKLLPVLAFVGGPGEILYWAALKPAFEILQMKVPPVVQRLSFTLIDAKAEKIISEFGLRIEEIMKNGIEPDRIAYLARTTGRPVSEVADRVKLAIEKAHQPLKQMAKDIQSDLGQMAEKNLFHLLREVEYLEHRIMHSLEMKHHQTMEKFDWLDVYLHPEGGLQERQWNVVPFLNEHGKQWIHQLCEAEVDYHKQHFLAYL